LPAAGGTKSFGKVVGSYPDAVESGNIRRLPADPVAKKQKTEPRKTEGSWGGARRKPGFEAKHASSGTAKQKGAKGKFLSE
jgi:hypothetical protein